MCVYVIDTSDVMFSRARARANACVSAETSRGFASWSGTALRVSRYTRDR